MPTYDYMCDSCGYAFEVQHKMTDDPVTICPQCGKTVRQVFSAGFGLTFTGKGFYQTDTQKKKESSVHTEKNDTKPDFAEKNGKTTHSCGNGCSCSGKCSCAT